MVRVSVAPTLIELFSGVTVTWLTAGRVTVTEIWPLWFSLVALIVEVPAATALTTPVALTFATVVSLDDHAIALPLRVFPAASFGVAVSVALPSPAVSTTSTRRFADPGVMVTEATAAAPPPPPPPPPGGPVTSLLPPHATARVMSANPAYVEIWRRKGRLPAWETSDMGSIGKGNELGFADGRTAA